MHAFRFSLSSLAAIALLVPAASTQSQPRVVHGLTPEQAEILSHMSLESLPDGQGGQVKTIRFTGVNLQVVNGLGLTNTENGAGNIIAGYSELLLNQHTGSHNFVGGMNNTFTSHGGLVVGLENAITSPWATVSGGRKNMAAAPWSSVSGGYGNDTLGRYSSVSGGRANLASGYFASVSGGFLNQAFGLGGSVLGGVSNRANGTYTTISGGASNTTYDRSTSILGGFANQTLAPASSVSGGAYNKTYGWGASVSGGAYRSASGLTNWVAGTLLQEN